MLSTAIQKDIGEYKPKLIAGLTVRTTVGLGIGLALAGAVVGIGHFLLGATADDVSVLVMLAVGGCFLASYIEPWGLPFEEAAPLFLNDRLNPSVLTMKSSNDLALEEIERERRAEERSAQSKKEAKVHAKALREEEDRIEDCRELCPELYLAELERARARIWGYEI